MTHDHHHDHHHDQDFDWEAMADQLELEATLLLPLVGEIVRDHTPFVDWPSAHHILDLGCGPGVITCALARHAGAAQLTALDSSVPLLARARAHAAADDLARRVHTIEADMESVLPALRPMDVIWAGMVLHHVADPRPVLTNLHQVLQPGGTLIMIEFAGQPTAVPDHDPLVQSGAWARMEGAIAGEIRNRLGLDPVTVDWPTLLGAAGFTDITDRTITVEHEAPLDDVTRAWLVAHVRRGLEWAADPLSPDDAAGLAALADSVATRSDLFVRAERRVLTARRPPPGRS